MNFIERYMKFAEPLTEAPRQFHYYMAYELLSCAIQDRAHYTGSGSFPMAPNLWFIFIGPSSITKKSTMLNIAMRHVFANASIDFEEYQHGGSQENFLETLSERPKGIIIHSEFMNFMEWLNRDYNTGLSSILAHLFDQPKLYKRSVGTRSKRNNFIIKEPFINIATATTIVWMNETLKENKITGGFIPRFNLILSRDPGKCIPETPDPDETLRKELVWELEKIKASKFGKMVYSKQARDAYLQWYREYRDNFIKNAPPNLVPCLSRKMADIHKFSMINAIVRNNGESCNEMNFDDFKKAVDTISQITEYTQEVISEKIALNPYQASRQRVLDGIMAGTGTNGGCPHSKLLKQMKMKGKDMRDILDSLIEEKTILSTKEGSPRPRVLYHINQEPDNENN